MLRHAGNHLGELILGTAAQSGKYVGLKVADQVSSDDVASFDEGKPEFFEVGLDFG